MQLQGILTTDFEEVLLGVHLIRLRRLLFSPLASLPTRLPSLLSVPQACSTASVLAIPLASNAPLSVPPMTGSSLFHLQGAAPLSPLCAALLDSSVWTHHCFAYLFIAHLECFDCRDLVCVSILSPGPTAASAA